MRMRSIVLFAILVAALSVAVVAEKAALNYPETKKVDQVDDYFGTKVADPYRWLEDDNAEDVKAWVTAQNEVTFAYLEKIPGRDKLRDRITELYNYPKYSSPFKAGDYYFFQKNDGLQNQYVTYYQKGLDGEPEVFIDPNKLSKDGTTRIGLMGFSTDHKYVAISRSEAGSDWREIRVIEVATKKELPDQIKWVKFSGAAWYGDGFFYSSFDAPKEGDELKGKNEYQKIRYHKLGDPLDKDVVVYEDKDNPLRWVYAGVSEGEEYLFLYVSEGTHGNELFYRELDGVTGEFKPLVTGFDYDSHVVEVTDGKFLMKTAIGAPNYRVVLVDPGKPEQENWKDVIPERPEVLRGASTGGGQLFCSWLKDAYTQVEQFGLDGKFVRKIELPTVGSAGGFGGEREDTEFFYSFSSFTYPSTIYKYDIGSGKSDVFRKSEVKFDPEGFEAKQVFYKSKDGTKVPMFIVHKKGLKLDGKNPTYLYGYGGFQVSITPRFSATRIAALEQGVIMAIANIRGGGEYGEKWHEAGMLENKQNVFDDFIAAAEYLIAEKYTSSERLAIAGGSNGGTLVGACMNQRPDLFAVALPAVGVMDMLRYHKFTSGWGWAVEYGSSDNEEQFRFLYDYSPLHNIKAGVEYPATMVTTADHDDRVVPAHSFKFIAELQDMYKGSNPVLIRIETKSGHGSVNTSKMIQEMADEFAFMLYNMGVKID